MINPQILPMYEDLVKIGAFFVNDALGGQKAIGGNAPVALRDRIVDIPPPVLQLVGRQKVLDDDIALLPIKI